MSECKVLGCRNEATHLIGGTIQSEVCQSHAGERATPIEEADDE